MKSPTQPIGLIFLLTGFFLLGCKKEIAPPVTYVFQAFAGKDRVISLPADTVHLEGWVFHSEGVDYLWKKISGPGTPVLETPKAAKTVVRNLEEGEYTFEFSAKNKNGDNSKDTVIITVLSFSEACNEVSLEISSGAGKISSFGHLSQPAYTQPATAADKLLFASVSTGNVDIYNLTTRTWSTAALSTPAGHYFSPVVVGNKILFVGSNPPNHLAVVDIYDASANTWSNTALNIPVWMERDAVGIVHNKAFFAGQRLGLGSAVSDKVDMYDASSNNWSVFALSVARSNLSTASAGNKILFAGGSNGIWDPSDGETEFFTRVDIYDAFTNTWSTAELSEARSHITAASIGNKVIFAGGLSKNAPSNFSFSDRIDIYDVSTNQWTTATLSEARSTMKAAVVGDKLLLAGGVKSHEFSDKVDIYDASAGTWSVATLSVKRVVSSTARLETKVLFFTGPFSDQDFTSSMDIYDAATNSWSTTQLNYPIDGSIITAGNQIFIGGGLVDVTPTVYPPNFGATCQVWTFEF